MPVQGQLLFGKNVVPYFSKRKFNFLIMMYVFSFEIGCKIFVLVLEGDNVHLIEWIGAGLKCSILPHI